jgi:hypothetical protein
MASLTYSAALNRAAGHINSLAVYAANIAVYMKTIEDDGELSDYDTEDYHRYIKLAHRDYELLDKLFTDYPEVKKVFGETAEALRTIAVGDE